MKPNDDNTAAKLKRMHLSAHVAAAGRLFLLCLFCLVMARSAGAQLSEEELRRERRETMEELRRTENAWKDYQRGPGWRVSFGSWISTSYNSSAEDDRDRAVQDVLDHTWDNNLRIFMSGRSGTGKTKVYARVGTQYTANSRVSPAIAKRNWIQPSVEMAYLEKSFGSGSFKQNVVLGRQFIQVKNALAFAMVSDGIKYEIKTRRQAVETFFVRQSPGDNNIDFLAPKSGRTKRWFFGSQYFWDYTKNQSLNFFGLWNKDANDDRPDATGQRHRLDSIYLGATFYGSILPRLKYELQYINEFGKTYADSTNLGNNTEVDVDARAFHAGLKYYFSGSLNLLLHTEYLYGSGDADAVGNVYSTDGGSGSQTGSGDGGKDRRFISFGGKNLGFALAPALTNLRIYKSGFSLKPFGWSENSLWNDIRLHPQVYFYQRDKAAGATSDPYMIRGAGASAKVGHEIDVDLAWRLMSDVKYTLKFGKFYPGAAYLGKSPETAIHLKFSVDL